MPARHLPAAAVFDWDGTLVDTMAMIYRANVASLRHYGLTMSREWFREQYTPDWRRGYQELGIPEHLWDEMAGRWAAEMAGCGRARCPGPAARSATCAAAA